MADLFDLCHSRQALAALVVADLSQDVLDTVKTRYNKGRISPNCSRLEIIQAPELLTPDPERAKKYAREHFPLPESPIIPCFYVVVDERTAVDGSVLFVQQDWPDESDDFLRTYPEHVFFLSTGFIMGDDDWERCQEEWHDELDVYAPVQEEELPGVMSVVRFPKSFASLTGEDEDGKDYVLHPEAAQQLGLKVEGHPMGYTAKQRPRAADGTFGEFVYMDVYKNDIVSPSDELRVWDTSDFFQWGVDSEI